eukprot:47586-Pyramimonas_sp.AAC.1
MPSGTSMWGGVKAHPPHMRPFPLPRGWGVARGTTFSTRQTVKHRGQGALGKAAHPYHRLRLHQAQRRGLCMLSRDRPSRHSYRPTT